MESNTRSNSRGNKYSIEILLDNSSIVDLCKSIHYAGGKSNTDTLEIKNNKIRLICYRSSKIKLENIFYNNNSSLNNQIIKSLLYYFGITNTICKMVKITVERSASKGVLDRKELLAKDILQIFTKKQSIPYNISIAKLDLILDETAQSYSLRNSLSHYLTGYSKSEAHEKFEKYWKSFNALYKSITNQPQDKNALRDLRSLTLENSSKMKFSNAYINQITSDQINKLAIRSYILKDFPTSSKKDEFIGFVRRYTDYRVLNAIKDRDYGIQKENLTATDITNLNNHISANNSTTSDTELTFFLTGKFGYAIRNQIFHAEKIDNEFKISKTKNIDDLEFINMVFTAYIIDLFNLGQN